MKFSIFNVLINDDKIPKDHCLVCNTATGETFLADARLQRAFTYNDIELLTETEIQNFITTGILLQDDNIDESLPYCYFQEREKFSNKTLNLTILLTMACNLRCVYCYEAAGIVSSETMNTEVQKNLIDFIKNQITSRELTHLALWLFGGEPLLYFEKHYPMLDELLAFCNVSSISFSTYIVTNGTLINYENLDRLVKYNCQYVQITLDGPEDIHDKRRIDTQGRGSFDKTLEGIKKVVSCSKISNPVIRINIDKTNIDVAIDTLEFLYREELNCCSIDFGIVKSTTPACASYVGSCFLEEELGEILEPLYKQAQNLGFETNFNPTRRILFCGLYGETSFTIAPNGDVYKCWDFVNQKQHCVGKIGKNGAFEGTTSAYFQWMTRNPYYIEECRSCKFLPACGGGCAGIAYDLYGTYNAPGCHKIKSVFEKQIINRFSNEIENQK